MVKKYTREILISELKRFFIINHRSPTTVDFTKNKNFPSNSIYFDYFSTWDAALKAANLEIHTHYKYTNEELIDALKRFYKENNRIPRLQDMKVKDGYPSFNVYRERFKNFKDALKLANLYINNGMKYSDQYLLNELHRFVKENNRIPTCADLSNGYPASLTYQTHFGTFNNALKLAGLPINELHLKCTGDEICELCGSPKTFQWNNVDNKRICNKCASGPRYYVKGLLNPNSSCGMGVITEHVVYKVLNEEWDDCKKCNTEDDFNSDYDLISNKYGNINVKSSTIYLNKYCKSSNWRFVKHHGETIPDYYICIGFDKSKTEILKVWIIPYNSFIINKSGICVTNSPRGLRRAFQYEVDPKPYNDVYQNLDIYSLPEFCNLK